MSFSKKVIFMSHKPVQRRTTSRIDPKQPPVPSQAQAELDTKEVARREFLRLRGWQMRFMYFSWLVSAIAIGFYFAHQYLLAQLMLGLATLGLIGLCWISYQRYNRNRARRNEIMATLDVMQDEQLRAVFNEARQERGLPPDEKDTTGYTATMSRERARIAAKTGQPDRVEQLQSKDKGANDGRKQS